MFSPDIPTVCLLCVMRMFWVHSCNACACARVGAPLPLVPEQTFKYNALESLLLATSMFILLAGMAFQSGVAAAGSGPHLLLTYAVAAVLVGSVCVFVAMLAVEVWNSVRFARRVHRTVRRATALQGAGAAQAVGAWTNNPLKGGPAAAAGVTAPAAGGSRPSIAPLARAPAPPPLPPPPPPPPSRLPAADAQGDEAGSRGSMAVQGLRDLHRDPVGPSATSSARRAIPGPPPAAKASSLPSPSGGHRPQPPAALPPHTSAGRDGATLWSAVRTVRTPSASASPPPPPPRVKPTLDRHLVELVAAGSGVEGHAPTEGHSSSGDAARQNRILRMTRAKGALSTRQLVRSGDHAASPSPPAVPPPSAPSPAPAPPGALCGSDGASSEGV